VKYRSCVITLVAIPVQERRRKCDNKNSFISDCALFNLPLTSVMPFYICRICFLALLMLEMLCTCKKIQPFFMLLLRMTVYLTAQQKQATLQQKAGRMGRIKGPHRLGCNPTVPEQSKQSKVGHNSHELKALDKA